MNRKLMDNLCFLDQKSLVKNLFLILRKKYKKVIRTKEYVIAEGDIPIALVAHLDTVFQYGKREIFYDQEKQVMWSPQGLGADDRAGVYAILQIINMGYRPHIIFSTDEEMGCIGANKLVVDIPESPFKDLKYIIQLDRRGSNDCVFYDCENKEFTKYVEKFGFVEEWGSFSDISVIAPVWGVAAVNLSIGYEDEHCQYERLYVKDMNNTIKKVINMLIDARDNSIPNYAYVKRPKRYKSIKYGFNKLCAWCGGPIGEDTAKIRIGKSAEEVCGDCFTLYMQYTN